VHLSIKQITIKTGIRPKFSVTSFNVSNLRVCNSLCSHFFSCTLYYCAQHIDRELDVWLQTCVVVGEDFPIMVAGECLESSIVLEWKT
jgi:hypothetical protein